MILAHKGEFPVIGRGIVAHGRCANGVRAYAVPTGEQQVGLDRFHTFDPRSLATSIGFDPIHQTQIDRTRAERELRSRTPRAVRPRGRQLHRGRRGRGSQGADRLDHRSGHARVTVRPTTALHSTLTPSRSRKFTSWATMALGSLNSGMP